MKLGKHNRSEDKNPRAQELETEEAARPKQQTESLHEFLRRLVGVKLDLTRNKNTGRNIDLE